MAQTAATFLQEGDTIQYTFSSDASAGDVLEVGCIPMVVVSDVAVSANAIGELAVAQVWKVPQKAEAIGIGEDVYWDPSGDPVTGTAGSGAATSTPGALNVMGICVETTTTSDSYVKVWLSAIARGKAIS